MNKIINYFQNFKKRFNQNICQLLNKQIENIRK
jgi:hypothetical protein